MRKNLHKILVTGGAGFIGSEFVRQAFKKGYKIIVVDKLTYAGDLERLKEIDKKYKFYRTDICNKTQIESIFRKEKPEIVVHFAAESHVDRSIWNATSFIKTNIEGTKILLDVAKNAKIKKFIHISTDEVYGEIKRGQFYENSPLSPSSPYSASKASADLLVRSYIRTYNFPVIIVRPSNNYGPWQYPEKFIPVAIYKSLRNEEIPLYGKGFNVREWLHVTDCAEGILRVMEKGKIKEIYNLGSGEEKRNIDVAKKILKILGKSESLIKFVKDRPGHDYRYSINFSKVSKLGWRPKVGFEKGIKETVNWYKQNLDWLERKVKYLRNYWGRIYN